MQDSDRALPLRRAVLAERRRVSGAADPRSMDALHALASVLHATGDAAEAEPLFDEWLMLLATRPREVSAWHAEQLAAAAALSMYRGAPERAEAMHREALSMRRALFGDRHHLVVTSLVDLSALLGRTQRLEEAEPLHREAIDILRVTCPQDHPQLASALKQHGVVLNRLRRFTDAQPPVREALAMRRRLLGSDNIGVGAVELDLTFALTMDGDYGEAEAVARDAARIYRAALGDDNSMVFFANAHLADALRGLGRYREAEPLLLAAHRRFDPPRPVTAQWHRYVLSALVRLYEADARPDEAARYRELLTASLIAASPPARPRSRPDQDQPR